MRPRVSAQLQPQLLTWGDVRLHGMEEVEAGSICSFRVDVTAARTVPAGRRVEAWIHYIPDTAMPAAPGEERDTTARVVCERRGRRLKTYGFPEGPIHGEGTYFPYRRYAGAALDAELTPGDSLRFRFTDVTMQTYAESPANMRFVVMDDKRLEGYFGDVFWEVRGGAADHLLVVAPTCVGTGETFECRIVARDRFRNRSTECLRDASFVVTDEGGLPIEHGGVDYEAERGSYRIRGLRASRGGVLRLDVTARDGALAGVSNPVVIRDEWPERVYWGDIHQHTYLADGRGTPSANYASGANEACLDFCAVTPHQEYTFGPPLVHVPGAEPQQGWAELVEATERWNRPSFATILGSEAGSLELHAGHMNAYYLSTANEPELLEFASGPRVTKYGDLDVGSYARYVETLRRRHGDVLLLPHAHAGGGPGRFDLPVLPDIQTNVEVVSVHGVFEEFYHAWLAHGHRVGVHGGGDNHMPATGNCNPGCHYPNTNGLTGAFAPGLSRRSVWDAFRQRRTCAVTGNQRIFLEFGVNDVAMGGVLQEGGRGRARVSVAGTAPVLCVSLLRNGNVFKEYRPPSAVRSHLRLMWTDSLVSRRPDESETRGHIRPAAAGISSVRPLLAYNQTDTFRVADGAVEFRSNGYSGIRRGCILELEGDLAELVFEINDTYLGSSVLRECLRIDPPPQTRKIKLPMAVPGWGNRCWFSKQPHVCEFTLDVDRVDPGWSRDVETEWEIEMAHGEYYHVRVEQVDGHMAWSSPVWIECS